MKKAKTRYILYGLLGIAILFASYWGFEFLKGTSLFTSTNVYYIYYDRIEGLNESSPVTVNGYQIGKVSEITFLPKDNCRLLVKIDISKEFLLPDSTIARIYSMDLMGSKGIELVFGGKSTYHSPGDTLIGQVEQSLKDQVSVQMLPVKQKAEELMVEISKAIAVISYIFNDETRDNLEKSFASIKATMAYLESSAYSVDTLLKKESGKIGRILANVEYLTLTLKDNAEHLSNIFDNLSTFSDTLVALDISKTIIEANKAIESFNAVMDKVNNGEGSLGQLIQDDKLANEIEQAAENLRTLLFDIQFNPKKYVHFSLMNIGRTVNVTDETELTDRDRRVVERQREKNEKEAQRNFEKDQKKKQKEEEKSDGASLDGPVIFMIQIKSAATQIDINSPELMGYTDVIEKKSGSYYRYYIYQHDNKAQTSYYLNLAREDFEDAFPVAFCGNTALSYSEGISLVAQK
ncbi:MAG: MlaD family protein [Bacteroidales bacterium]|nr:MlaD family protein [Bacteroidales bacterium]MDD3860868.1 MlaD family protein [Bacteroidales bacterium]